VCNHQVTNLSPNRYYSQRLRSHELRGYSDSNLSSNQVMIDESEERIRRDYGGYNNGYRAPGRGPTEV